MIGPFAGDDQNEESIFQARLKAIQGMPPEQQQAALADLARDYPGRMAQAKERLSTGAEMYSAPTPGMREGPSGNPYAVSIAANPLEHLATCMGRYMGGRDMKEARQEMKDLSAGKERGLGGLMESWATSLRQPQGSNPFYETEEERRRRLAGMSA